MAPVQKAAWFNLITVGGTVLLFLMAVPILGWAFHRPWSMVAFPASGVFGLLGLTGLTSFFFRARKDGLPALDERDQALLLKAWRFGMGIFWVTFVATCMSVWGVMRYGQAMERVTLPVEIFPWMIGIGYIVFMLAQSVATLHYYGWRWSDEAGA